MGNLDFYEAVRKPDPKALKPFDNGKFHGTDINTMWRIKTLTEHFGPCGIGWYYTVDKKWTETTEDNTVMAFADISLFIRQDGEWSKPIHGTGGNRQAYKTKSGYLTTSDECYKMAVTDAFGNACRSLGLGADVYWDNDTTKYTVGAVVGKTESVADVVIPTADEQQTVMNIIAKRKEIQALRESLKMETEELYRTFEKKYGKPFEAADEATLDKCIADMKAKVKK